VTLHEAIVKLLLENGQPMSTTDIAEALTKIKWYQKKDGSAITAYQIHGRTKNYPDLFSRDGLLVYLKSNSQVQLSVQSKPVKEHIKPTEIKNPALLEKILMNENNFKLAGSVDDLIPDNPGIYCIRITDPEVLKVPFSNKLKERDHNIIYIGIASKSLKKRFLNQELRAKGHGSFFRSIGAVLGYLPPKGLLAGKHNKKNYKFSSKDEREIIKWTSKNLLVNWIETPDNLRELEHQLIMEHKPLLNITGNPYALQELKSLRERCRRVACI
jgi:hypothetical protein